MTVPPDPIASLPHRDVLEHLRGREDEMVAFLEELVRAESPTDRPETQDRPLALIEETLGGLGWTTRRARGRQTGQHLLARPVDAGERAGLQLLLGHCDTVWPVGTLEEMPLEREGPVLRGPGVYDMKGGLTQMVFALRTLHELGLRPTVAPVVFVNSDEEIGSTESRRFVHMLARRSVRAFVFEPADGPRGALKTARKGTGQFEVRVVGQGAHAGVAPEEGASAILELSHVVQALHDLSEPERGVTVSVGLVEGGVRRNVIAPSARAVVDVRVPTPEDAERVTSAIHGLEAVTPGTRLEVEGGMSRPPMQPNAANRALWTVTRRAGSLLGLDLVDASSGGGSDANLTSRWTPTLDGLGPVGDGAHADHEHIRVDRMVERTALAALLLLLPPELPPA